MEEEVEKFRSRLIEEFRELLSGKEADLPVDTDAVLVLSHSGLSEENTARTYLGIELVKKITATRLNLAEGAQPNSEQIGESGPVLLLDGTPEQNADMARIARESGIPDLKIAFVPNPPPPGANTKTQFELIPPEFKKSGVHLTLVSSDYHGSRVVRIGDRILPPGVNFTFVGMPWAKKGAAWTDKDSVRSLVKREARRIERYLKEGDISKLPQRGAIPPEDKSGQI